MDYTIYSLINGLAGRVVVLDKTMVFIAQNFQYLFAIILLLLWFKKDTKEKVTANRKAAILAMLAMLIALGINHIIAFVYFRPRPYTLHVAHLLVSPSVDPSFPSDHATFSFALALPILVVNKYFGRIMIGMSLLLCFARVYVGLHYPLDVVGGAIVAYATYKAIQKFPKYFDYITNFVLKIWEMIVFRIYGQK
ncbi:MAG TPA: undecaprenyl-diphosphatase [Clostridium sp.]|uniref:undecaprenyl-diphosphatase n=1 Tax=Clostridium sp. TaxID=1506 RepID=UPI002F92B1F3